MELLGVFTNLRMQMKSFSKMMAMGGMGESVAACLMYSVVALRLFSQGAGQCFGFCFKMMAMGGMGAFVVP